MPQHSLSLHLQLHSHTVLPSSTFTQKHTLSPSFSSPQQPQPHGLLFLSLHAHSHSLVHPVSHSSEDIFSLDVCVFLLEEEKKQKERNKTVKEKTQRV